MIVAFTNGLSGIALTLYIGTQVLELPVSDLLKYMGAANIAALISAFLCWALCRYHDRPRAGPCSCFSERGMVAEFRARLLAIAAAVLRTL